MPATLTSDPLGILLGHNRWANRELLNRSREFSPAQFHQRFEIGPGSLHDTLSHIIGATFRWADRIDGRPLRPSIERPPSAPKDSPMSPRTPEELTALNDQACADLAAVVARVRGADALAQVRDWKFGDESCRFTVCAAIIHVTNHGMHHRAQCLNMFRHLGMPLHVDLDELEWQVAGEP